MYKSFPVFDQPSQFLTHWKNWSRWRLNCYTRRTMARRRRCWVIFWSILAAVERDDSLSSDGQITRGHWEDGDISSSSGAQQLWQWTRYSQGWWNSGNGSCVHTSRGPSCHDHPVACPGWECRSVHEVLLPVSGGQAPIINRSPEGHAQQIPWILFTSLAIMKWIVQVHNNGH